MLDQLSHLYLGLPQMRSISFLTIITLKVRNNVIHNKCLLQVCTRDNLLLNGDLDLKSFGVGFSPDEGGVDELHSFKAFNLL